MRTAKEGGLQLLLSIMLVTACYTTQDLKTAECATACRREGYKGGQYVKEGTNERCYCYDSYEYKNLTKQLLKLPSRGNGKNSFGPANEEGF